MALSSGITATYITESDFSMTVSSHGDHPLRAVQAVARAKMARNLIKCFIRQR